MDARILVEANLLPVPKGGAFLGFIEPPPQESPSSLENLPISIFNPDCTIGQDIQPGDIVLCQETAPPCTGILHFYSPLRLFTKGNELFAFLQQNPEVPIRAWDYDAFFAAVHRFVKLSVCFKENSDHDLIPEILRVLTEVNWEGRESFVFPKIKCELLERVRSTCTESKLRQYLFGMTPTEIATFSAGDWVEFFAPFLRDVAWWYDPTPVLSAWIHKVFTEKDKLECFTSIKEALLKNFAAWAIRFNPFVLKFNDIIPAHPELVKVRASIFEAYIQPLRNATMFFRGRTYKQFWVCSLRQSFLGKKLLEDIHVPRGRDWVDTRTFNLIHAALRQINVNIAPQKYSRRLFWAQRSQK